MLIALFNEYTPSKEDFTDGYMPGDFCGDCWPYVTPPKPTPTWDTPLKANDIGGWQEIAIRCVEDIDLEDGYLATE